METKKNALKMLLEIGQFGLKTPGLWQTYSWKDSLGPSGLPLGQKLMIDSWASVGK